MDLVVRSPRFPRPGETLAAKSFGRFPGGKGANQAIAAARTGAAVSMIGAVGDDAFGREFLETLRRDGVDVSHVRTAEDLPTGVGLIVIDEAPDAGAANTILVALGANLAVEPAHVDAARAVISRCDVLLMQLENPMPAVARAAEIARDSGATVMLNAAPAAKVPPEVLSNVDVLVMNEHEGAAMCGPLQLDEPEALAAKLATIGPEVVILTLGGAGALASVRGRAVVVPAFPVTPVDTVGAGDAFCGAFACRWAEQQVGGSLDQIAIMDALCWGCAAGAICVTRQGAIPSLPSRSEVAERLRRRNQA